jgi:glycosyltransferase involved in cell wall biosynthesis
MSRLRILVLGSDCNPEEVSIPYVTYSHAAALAQLHDVTLVARSPSEDALRRANAPFRAIEVVRMPILERIFELGFRWIFRNNYNSQALTAFRCPFHLVFEWRAWRQFRRRIFAGEFDVVLRIVPVAAVIPSPFASLLRKGPIPFVVGPVQSALPYVRGFSQAENEKQWSSSLRNLYRFLPFARSTYRHAAAIIAASSQACVEFAAYSDKLFYIPEPGISPSLCSGDSRNSEPGAKLELIFVGGLVPRKACDLALRAACPMLQSGMAHFTVLGDGPERNRLEQLTRTLGIEKAVSFRGWLSHTEVLGHMRSADVMVFPSVRENGAGVVFEALASGAVPVVADFGGPGDIVHPDVGYKVPLTEESDFVSQMENILKELASNRDRLNRLRQQGVSYARERLTWDAKARCTTQVLNWVARRAPKPILLPPKRLHLESASSLEKGSPAVESRDPIKFEKYNMKRVKRLLRPLVHQTLSPTAVRFLRFRWWYLSSYIPRLFSSRVVRRTPQVCRFGAALVPSIAEQLQSVNLLAPTEMCRVMTKFGSDKGRSNNYTPLYWALFKGRHDQPLRIFELGLGTNNPDLLSNMGVFGAPGASLRGWRQLFPHALVYGADIDREILFEEHRIKTFYCDQLDGASIRELWSHPDLRDGADIIIEDGLHTFEANISFLEASLDHLRPGGIYVTEDIVWDSIEQWYDRLERVYSKQYPTHEFAFVVPEARGCNNLLVVRRPAAGPARPSSRRARVGRAAFGGRDTLQQGSTDCRLTAVSST